MKTYDTFLSFLLEDNSTHLHTLSGSTLSLCRLPTLWLFSVFFASSNLQSILCMNIVRSFGTFSLLWPQLTSIYSLLLRQLSLDRYPRVRSDNLPLMPLPHLLYGIRAVLDFALFGKLIRPNPAFLWGFCSSARVFASSFLQIPLRSGHPCFWLTVPTAKPVVDFHHQVIAHAERTKKTESRCLRFLFIS